MLTIGCEMDERKMERLVAAAERIAKSLEAIARNDSTRRASSFGRAAPPFQVVDEAELDFDDDDDGAV